MISISEYQTIKDLYKTDCVFCKPAEQLIIKKTTNFTALLDIAPLSEGHTLISSNEHLGCIGEIPNEIFDEFIELTNDIRFLLEKEYGQIITFEHGRAGFCIPSSKDARLCHHFHLHILPYTADISYELKKELSQIEVKSFYEVKTQYEIYNEYLFFENNKNEKFFYPTNNEIPTHYLRTLLANAHSCHKDADWLAYNNPTKLISAQKILCSRNLDNKK